MRAREEEAETADRLSRVRDGDREAFAALYESHAVLVRGICRRLVGDQYEDVAQEVFLQVWNCAAEFDPSRGDPTTWIGVIARSRALDHLRRTKPRPGGPALVGGRPFELSDGIAVRDALRVLPPPERTVLELSFFQDLSQAQIAARLRQPLGTVKSRMRVGLTRLRRSLAASL